MKAPCEARYPLVYESQSVYCTRPLLPAFGGTLLDDKNIHDGRARRRARCSSRAISSDRHVPERAERRPRQAALRVGAGRDAVSGPWLAADLGDNALQ